VKVTPRINEFVEEVVILAVKRFNLGFSFEMEVEIMKSVLHVNLP